MEKDKVEGYINTINRFETEIHMTDAGAYGTSIAISLRRIADSMEKLNEIGQDLQRLNNQLETIKSRMIHR